MALEDTIKLLKASPDCMRAAKETTLNWDVLAYHVEVNRDFMPLFVSSAGTLITLASAAIGLSIAFREKVLGQSGPLERTPVLLGAWFSLLLSIATGACYLYAAPKHVQLRLACTTFTPLGIWPGHIYGTCVAFFIAGVLLLFAAILGQSRRAA